MCGHDLGADQYWVQDAELPGFITSQVAGAAAVAAGRLDLQTSGLGRLRLPWRS